MSIEDKDMYNEGGLDKPSLRRGYKEEQANNEVPKKLKPAMFDSDKSNCEIRYGCGGGVGAISGDAYAVFGGLLLMVFAMVVFAVIGLFINAASPYLWKYHTPLIKNLSCKQRYDQRIEPGMILCGDKLPVRQMCTESDSYAKRQVCQELKEVNINE